MAYQHAYLMIFTIRYIVNHLIFNYYLGELLFRALQNCFIMNAVKEITYWNFQLFHLFKNSIPKTIVVSKCSISGLTCRVGVLMVVDTADIAQHPEMFKIYFQDMFRVRIFIFDKYLLLFLRYIFMFENHTCLGNMSCLINTSSCLWNISSYLRNKSLCLGNKC